jgi:hypothetical protein
MSYEYALLYPARYVDQFQRADGTWQKISGVPGEASGRPVRKVLTASLRSAFDNEELTIEMPRHRTADGRRVWEPDMLFLNLTSAQGWEYVSQEKRDSEYTSEPRVSVYLLRRKVGD